MNKQRDNLKAGRMLRILRIHRWKYASSNLGSEFQRIAIDSPAKCGGNSLDGYINFN